MTIKLNKAKKVFEILKSKITDKVVLSKFNNEATLIIEADASPVGVGAVLLQKHKDNRFILYKSIQLFEAEKKYSQINREALFISFAVNKF